MSEAELIHGLNYKNEMLFNVIDTFDNQVYPIKEKDPEKFNEIMTQVYQKTHKTELPRKKLDDWIENFPNLIDRKIEAEKHKLKEKRKSPQRAKKSKKTYETSPLRNRNILSQMEKLGYYSLNTTSKEAKMKAGLKDDEIIADLVEEISDPYGNDHDMVEIDYDKKWRDTVKGYEQRYAYVYAVEDEEPELVKSKKSITKAPSKKPLALKYEKKAVKTPIKKAKEKLKSSIILSKNPIKITPVERLEHVQEIEPVKKKPVKKKRAKKKRAKKKPVKKKRAKKKPVKKKRAKKKPVVKKKPIVKKKPVKKKKPVVKKKPIVRKKPVKKKKPIVKKKPPVKKPVKKKKPLPKVKTMRAKKRNSPITGRWTARYRMIDRKKRKIKIRRWKGKIQTRILN